MTVQVGQLVSVCVQSMMDTLQSIAELNGKVVFANNDDDAMDNLKGVKPPMAAVLYEGMRALPDQAPGAKLGLSAEMVLSVVLINRTDAIRNTDDLKHNPLNLLDEVRQKLLGTRSPTGHYWRFVVEAAQVEKNGTVFWLQRWIAPVQAIHR